MDEEHNDIIENLPAYSLGILEPELAAQIDEHLAGCTSCESELAALDATTLALALSAPAVAPPLGARDRFAAMIRDDAQAQPRPALITPVVVPRPQAAPVRAIPAVQPREPQRRWWQLFSPTWGLAAACAVLLLIVGAWGWNQHEVGVQAQQERDMAIAYLGNANVQAYTLAATDGVSGSVRLWVDPASSRGLLVANDLAAAPNDQVYELWLIGDAPVAIDVFKPANGVALIDFTVPGSFSQYKVAAITVEHQRVAAPTTQPILVANI